MIKLIKPNFIDCTANTYDSSKPALPTPSSIPQYHDRNIPRIMISQQKAIWDLIKAGNFEGTEKTKYYCYLFGNPKGIQDIEQWILQYYDELEESRESTELK